MPKGYLSRIENAIPAGLVHTVWYFEKSVQASVCQLHTLKRTVNFVFGRMVIMVQKTWVLLSFWLCPVSAMPWFSSYEIRSSLLLIDPLACHCAATPREYAVTFSTIKSSGSVQNRENLVIVVLNECSLHSLRFFNNHSSDDRTHRTWFNYP